MATISSAGSIEGVDLTKVMGNASLLRPNAEAPNSLNTEDVAAISTGGRQKSAINALAEAASRLSSSQLWSSTVATSDAPAIVTARSSAQTLVGDYQINVTSLASGQGTSTAVFSSLSTVVGVGTLNIEMGSWDVPPTTFAPNPNWPKANVVLGPRNETLDRVRDKINAAGLGVVATVVSDATGSRLVLRSTSTGADSGFRITTEEADTADATAQDAIALSALGFDPSSATGGGMQLLQSASNAQIKINDESLESPMNVVESQSGLSLILKEATNALVTVSVQPDMAGMQQATQSFAQAYNALQARGGSAAQTVQSGTASLLGTPESPTDLGRTLAEAGITRTSAGELQINTQQLSAAWQQAPSFVRNSQTRLAQQVLADLPANMITEAPEANVPAPQNLAPAFSTPVNTAGTLLRQRLLDQYQGSPPEPGMPDNEFSFMSAASRA